MVGTTSAFGFLLGSKNVKRVISFGNVENYNGYNIIRLEVEIEIQWEPWAEEFQEKIKVLKNIHDIENIALVYHNNEWIHENYFR